MLAYVVTHCRDDADGFHSTARLEVRRGDDEPIIIKSNPTTGPTAGAAGICTIFGERRAGRFSVYGTPFQRLGVSPDGSRVVFEMTDDFSIISQDQVPPEDEGFYVARTDGSGLRKLAPASRDPVFHVAPDLLEGAAGYPIINFSPSGDLIAYSDLGPDQAGRQAPQVMTLNLDTGERRQLTRLPPLPPSSDPKLFSIVGSPVFLDDETVGFLKGSEGDTFSADLIAYTVKVSGDAEPVPLPPPLTVPGSQLVPRFLITGEARNAYALRLDSTTWELFSSDGRSITQLTNFGRDDTAAEVVLTRGQRALFIASGSLGGDPGSNPYRNCQVFSVDLLGGDLRQITSFDDGAPAQRGCSWIDPRPLGCFVNIVGIDADTVVLESGCDPLGTNPNGGQIFAINLDGTGLRQVTHTRGYEIHGDGTVTAEHPGPAALAGRR